MLRDCGEFLSKTHKIKVIDLIHMEKSHCYNPFVYIRCDNDIQRLGTNLFANVTPKGSQSQDPFWDQTAQMLLLALMFYLYYEAPPDEQNFPMVMEMIRAGEVREDMEDFTSPLDELFIRLEHENPDHVAVKTYNSYKKAAGKTLKSIQIILLAKLEKFNLDSLASESIVGNCDEFLYLGGNEQSSHKYVSELLGKETIDTNTYGRTRGRNGSYSTNLQITGRELMTPDEVRLMDNRYAILFIRGEHPIMDLKYDILKHPNVEYSTDGKGKPYEHGQDNLSVVSVELSQDEDILMEAIPVTEIDDDIIFLTDEELEKHIEQHGGINFDEL